jgi:hypothetical protein
MPQRWWSAKKGARHCARAPKAGRRPLRKAAQRRELRRHRPIQRVLGKQGVHNLASFTKIAQVNLMGT